MTTRLLYSYAEAADQLSISPRVLARLVKDGEIATVPIGRRRLVAADELENYVERLKRSA